MHQARSTVATLAVLALSASCAGAGAADTPGTVATGATEPATGEPVGVLEANAAVDHVIDGDTIVVIVGGHEERVRLLGVDTPEIAHDAFGGRPANQAECFGDEATAFTSGLLPVGTPVRLERDVVGRDDYGRLLAVVYRAADGIQVNYELVRQGYARPLTIPPNVILRDELVEAARAAESDGAGLWSACTG